MGYQSFDEVREHLIFDRTGQALETLSAMFSGDQEKSDQLDLLQKRNHSLEERKLLEVIAEEDYILESNKLTWAIIKFLNLNSSFDQATAAKELPRIVCFESSPADATRVFSDEEYRLIQKKYNLGQAKSLFQVDFFHAARKLDVLEQLFLDRKLHILHFSCLGGKDGIILSDNDKNTELYRINEFLLDLEESGNWPECLILGHSNASEYAIQLAPVKYVIAPVGDISNGNWVSFSESFYGYLFTGRSILQSFHLAKRAMKINRGLKGGDVEIFYGEEKQEESVEVLYDHEDSVKGEEIEQQDVQQGEIPS